MRRSFRTHQLSELLETGDTSEDLLFNSIFVNVEDVDDVAVVVEADDDIFVLGSLFSNVSINSLLLNIIKYRAR